MKILLINVKMPTIANLQILLNGDKTLYNKREIILMDTFKILTTFFSETVQHTFYSTAIKVKKKAKIRNR